MKRILLLEWLIVLTVGGWAIGEYFWGKAVTHRAEVLIPTGSNFARWSDSLRRSGALACPEMFIQAARIGGVKDSVHSGRYVLEAGESYAGLIRRMKYGLQTPVRLSFQNVRTVEQLAGHIAKRLELDSATLASALLNDSLSRCYGFTPQTFMSMFIPNTYEIYWDITLKGFLDRMQREANRFWESRDAKRSRSGLSREQVMTLASVVYEETKRKAEMPVIAGVYVNRLNSGMLLEACPTVKFALGDFGLKRILYRHLQVDSPYNTYKYSGLPPGPICMPSIDAIDAVLDYQHHDYYYFCAAADLSGTHRFARTLNEHNQNAADYANTLNRLKIR